RGTRGLLTDLIHVPARSTTENEPATSLSLEQRLRRLSPNEQLTLLAHTVRTHSAIVLGFSGPEKVALDRRFQDLGFDSLTGVELRNRLETTIGLKLSPTLVFDYPTPSALTRHLRDELNADGHAKTA